MRVIAKLEISGMALPRKDILLIEKNHAHSTTRLARFARQFVYLKAGNIII